MTKQRFLLFLFIIFYLAVLLKLFYLQILTPHSNKTDYLRTKRLAPERGRIYDRNGDPMAVNKASYLFYIEPKKIGEVNKFAEKIESILNISKASIEAKIDIKKDWLSLKNDLTSEQKDKLQNLQLTGIGFEDRFLRHYPEGSLSAHLLGFVGKDAQGEDLGYFGIEGFYNKDLSGLPGIIKSDRDLLGKPILIGTQQRLDPDDGRDIYLTIDKPVQEIAKNKLLSGLERYQAKEGCILIANPQTLEILALSCLPDFDVSQYYLFNEQYFKNPAISNVYEPGSTFKPLIVAAALEEKSIKPTDFYDEEGPIRIGSYTIRTWNNKYEGKISITRILEKSSNVGMVHIAQKLGQKNIYHYLKKYSFNRQTEIDLQGETAGFFKDEKDWYPIDYATASFGQGIAVTPIQMLRAFGSVINGGKLLKPHTVGKILSENNVKKIEPEIIEQPISAKTSEIIKKMLQSTVENGEIRWAKPKGYKVGGKTGTAQIAIEGHYDPSKTVASFIGFAPVDNPRFLALVILREPQTSPWGSETAAPLFFDIAKELLVYYNIPPE